MIYTQDELISAIIPILRHYPVNRVAIFGSYARNEQAPDSDVDLFLDLGVDAAHPSVDYIFDILSLIEDKICLKVDYLTTKGLLSNPSKRFREDIERDCRWFYEV